MRKILLATISSLLLLTSCNKYLAISIDGKGDNQKLEKLAFENDSIRVQFYFSDDWYDPLFQFEITNKLNVPIFVDWKNTVVTFNNNITNFSSNYNIVNINNQKVDNLNSTISGNIQVNSKPNIIPPNSFLRSDEMLFFRESYMETNELFALKNNKMDSKVFAFNELLSPKVLYFYLSTNICKNNGTERFYDFKFWISNVKRVMEAKENNNKDFSTFIDKIKKSYD